MSSTKRFLSIILLCAMLCSFQTTNTLRGTWEFKGGVLNSKYDPAPKDYKLQRKYSATGYDAFLLEKGEKTVKFESGNYKLKGDTCLETQTYSAQPTKLRGVTVHYWYTVRKDSLILRGRLPNGMVEEDYWKKIK